MFSTRQDHHGSTSSAVPEYRDIIPRPKTPVTYNISPDPTTESQSAKRLKACIACKDSKVKCRRDEQRADNACERCLSAGRQCITSARARNKRPRRNISTVASLESKVDALVAALKVKQAGDAEDHRQDNAIGTSAGSYTQASDSNAKKHNHSIRRSALQADFQYSLSFFMRKPPEQAKNRLEDVIDQGLISMEEAEACFSRFINNMLPHFPLAVFSPDVTASVVRETRPLLFLAMVGAASSHLGEGIRKLLSEESMRLYADRVFMTSDKNLDLVQAMLVTAIWYLPPERFDEVKVYQLFHFAAITATELEFGQAPWSNAQKLSSLKDGELYRSTMGASSIHEPLIECQRAWLSCYIVCSMSSLVTRRPCFMHWSCYMDECIRALEKSGIAVASDLYLSQLARSHRIAEEIGRQFTADNPSTNTNVCDLSTQYILQSYEQQVSQWKAQIPVEVFRPILQIEASTLSLYIHEVYLHDGPTLEKSALSLEEPSPMSASRVLPSQSDFAHRRALAMCIGSVKTVLDTFISLDTNTLCSIPLLYFIRAAHTVFAMMKIHFAARRLDGDLYDMVERDLNVELYITELLNSLQRLSHTKTTRVPALFRLMLLTLRTWFRRKKSQKDPNPFQVGRNDTIFQAVLQTADAMNTGSDRSDNNVRPEEPVIAQSFFHADQATGNTVPPAADSWPLELDEDMLSWSDLDFEALLNIDHTTLFQMALERMGGFAS